MSLYGRFLSNHNLFYRNFLQIFPRFESMQDNGYLYVDVCLYSPICDVKQCTYVYYI